MTYGLTINELAEEAKERDIKLTKKQLEKAMAVYAQLMQDANDYALSEALIV